MEEFQGGKFRSKAKRPSLGKMRPGMLLLAIAVAVVLGFAVIFITSGGPDPVIERVKISSIAWKDPKPTLETQLKKIFAQSLQWSQTEKRGGNFWVRAKGQLDFGLQQVQFTIPFEVDTTAERLRMGAIYIDGAPANNTFAWNILTKKLDPAQFVDNNTFGYRGMAERGLIQTAMTKAKIYSAMAELSRRRVNTMTQLSMGYNWSPEKGMPENQGMPRIGGRVANYFHFDQNEDGIYAELNSTLGDCPEGARIVMRYDKKSGTLQSPRFTHMACQKYLEEPAKIGSADLMGPWKELSIWIPSP